MSKILIVEDDLSIQALLHDFIQEAGHSVILASDGVEALAKYSEQDFDLVLLDIMLPKIDGYGVCEVIRQKSDVPIIMLTALDGEENQIRGLDLQADDYITKPFSMPVLLRKIAAVLRRSSKLKCIPQTMSYRNLKLDLDGYKAYAGGEGIDLTPREFEILRELLVNRGRILTRQNHLTATQSISPEIYILGDMQLLQKALDNLLGNAAAYSGAGNQILIKLWKETETTTLTIENTGAHIPDEAISKLFEPFYRVDQSRNRQTGGTGLGLYIVKTILDLHGAKIEIANTIQGVIVSIQF